MGAQALAESYDGTLIFYTAINLNNTIGLAPLKDTLCSTTGFDSLRYLPFPERKVWGAL